EPGMGKTRLLLELAAFAAGTGPVVLWGCATEFERQVPFGVFANAIEDHLANVDPDRLAALRPERLALLSAAFPSAPLGQPDLAGDTLIEAGRHRLHRAVRELLELMAGQQPLVLVLDDVHWADDGSVELLGYLLRHPPRAPLLLAVACRPRQ